jgi:hypothetical protein
MRRVLTGFVDADWVDDGVDVDVEVPLGPGFFSGVLLVLDGSVDLGRRLLVFFAVPEVAGFSFGRDVRNAPRTSPSSCKGAANPITTAQRQTSPKAMTLNRISESPCCRITWLSGLTGKERER